jgi:hypothetical protein
MKKAVKKKVAKKKAPKVIRPVGRPPIADEPLSREDILARWKEKLKADGVRQFTVRVKSQKALDVLALLTSVRNHPSETAALTWLIENTLPKLEKKLLAEQAEKSDSQPA